MIKFKTPKRNRIRKRSGSEIVVFAIAFVILFSVGFSYIFSFFIFTTDYTDSLRILIR